MTIGEKIKEIRLNRGLKQSDLAEKSGLSRVAIGNYERNDRTPGTEQVERIAHALGVSPVDLVGWDYFDSKVDTIKLSKEVEEIRLFESYLSSLGYVVQTMPDGERSITKGKMTAKFNQTEFNELQAKFSELNADIQTLIEARIQSKAKK